MRRNRVAVSELFEVGGKNAAILQMDSPLIIKSRNRHDFAIRCPNRCGPAIGRQQELVANGNFDRPPFENIKGFCLFFSERAEGAALGANQDSVLINACNLNCFVFSDTSNVLVKSQELPRMIVPGITLLGGGPVQ